MKRWIAGALLVIALILVGGYFLLPASRAITVQATLPASEDLIYRSFTSGALLQKWWPGTVATGGQPQVSHNGYTFFIKPGPFRVVSIRTQNGVTPAEGFVMLMSLKEDSTLVVWKSDVRPGNGLLSRVQTYRSAQALKKEMAAVLAALKTIVQDDARIYNLKINEERVTDTLLVVTRTQGPVRPAPSDYYGLLQTLQQHIAAQGAQETNFPMLSVRPMADSSFETMVAIPVNKVVADKGAVVFRRMIPGKILVSEVRGGPAAVDAAFTSIEQYMAEHSRKAPGRAFQSLVTNRQAEKDTAKWITKIYYPVL